MNDEEHMKKVKNMYDDLNKYQELYETQYRRNELLDNVIRKLAHDLFEIKYGRTPTYEEQKILIKEYFREIEDNEIIN